MNQREKFLAYAVGSLVVLVAAQYLISGYRDALQIRRTRVANLESKVEDQKFEEAAGQQAMDQLNKYRERSLSSDPETAQSDYKQWLEKLVGGSNLSDWSIDYVGDQGSNRLFRVYTFRVVGTGNIRDISELIRDFHDRNYLQRTKKLVLRRSNDSGELVLNLDVEAVALADAPKDQSAPATGDPRVGESSDEYMTAIMNRNMFSPPNREPKYAGSKSLEAFLERDFAAGLKFDDPDEGDRVSYEIVGDLPEGFQFDRGQIIGRPKEKGMFTVLVKAWDTGLPRREVEEKIEIRVVDPPVEVEPEGPPVFDEAKQAILTGLVLSRGQWSAWINVRTRTQLLKLKAGDDFKVGSISGKMVEVTDRYAVFECDGETYTLEQDASLADAKAAAVN